MRRSKRAVPLSVVLGILAIWGLSFAVGCRDEGRGRQNNYTPPVCVADGVCQRGNEYPENCFNCPMDCCVSCDPTTITPATGQDFLVAEMRWPGTEWPVELGLDLDGDGEIDNNGGGAVRVLETHGASFVTEQLNQRIARGELLMVVRIHADSLVDDEQVLAQVLPVVSVDGTPLFDGSDEVMITPGATLDGYSCGVIVDGTLDTYPQPGGQLIPCPICPDSNELVWLGAMRLAGKVDDQPITDLIVAGGLFPEEMYAVLLPDLRTLMNETITEAADRGDATTVDAVADYFDGNCVVLEDVPGCEHVVAGVGECDDTSYPPVITDAELRCNALIDAALKPDLDIDGDDVGDLISIGWQVTAVPVTVVDGP